MAVRQTIFIALGFCLIASVFFTNLISTSLGSKFQFTEVLFLLILPFTPFKEVFKYNCRTHRPLIILLGVYFAYDLVNALITGKQVAILLSLGRGYLVLLFMILSYMLSLYSYTEMAKKLYQCMTTVAVLIILITIVAYLGIALKGSSHFIWAAKDYPYFGMSYRLSGPNMYATMMISTTTFVIFCLISSYKMAKNKTWLIVVVLILMLCAFATLSKSLILLAMALFILGLKRLSVLNKFTFVTVVIVFGSLFVFLTHIIVINKKSDRLPALKKSIYTSNKIIYQTNSTLFLETNYLTSKRFAVDIIRSHYLTGIGAGNFNEYIENYKKTGLYPQKLPDFDPQCTYLRAMVEDGIFGIIMLILILGYVLRSFIRCTDLFEENFLFCLFLVFVIFLLEAISTDILNFRHLWLFFAVALTYMNKRAEHLQDKLMPSHVLLR